MRVRGALKKGRGVCAQPLDGQQCATHYETFDYHADTDTTDVCVLLLHITSSRFFFDVAVTHTYQLHGNKISVFLYVLSFFRSYISC